MISLQRLAEPDILTKNGETWLQRFLERSNPRPDSRQYGHREIRDMLRAMSFHKCFYCERKLSESDGEVDHYIEVAESPELAFVWTNLYLSCDKCNGGKISNLHIPVEECLNPCDGSLDPADHLTFTDEIIRSRNGSLIGMRTIQKYRLDRDQLNYLRAKRLQQFERFVRGLHDVCIREGRRLNEVEKEAIASFGQADSEFSLMFRSYLTSVNLL